MRSRRIRNIIEREQISRLPTVARNDILKIKLPAKPGFDSRLTLPGDTQRRNETQTLCSEIVSGHSPPLPGTVRSSTEKAEGIKANCQQAQPAR